MRVTDLSVPLVEGENIVYPGNTYLKIHPIIDYSNNLFLSTNLEIWSHAGTHVDAPYHVVKDGPPIDKIDLDKLVREAVILNLSGVASEDHPLSATDLERAEQTLREDGESTRPGDIVLLRTDWSRTRRPWTPEYRAHSPYLTPQAADWLVEKRPAAVGFDFPEERLTKLQQSLKGRPSEHPLPIHYRLLGAGICLVEHLINLGKVKATRFLFVAAPLRIIGADGTPVRALAVEFQ